MKKNLFLMYTISFFQGMVFYASIATLYRQASGLSVFQIALIESISLALTLIFEIPWGILADHIGYRRTMIICCILFFVSKVIFWQAQGFAGFLTERVILAIVLSGFSGVDTSILFLSCNDQKSQHAFGIYESLGTAGLLTSTAIYAVFIGDDYRMAGFLTVISYGMAVIPALLLDEVKPAQDHEKISLETSLTILKGTLHNRRLLLLLVAAALINEVSQTITVFFNQLQYEKAGMSARFISVVYILVTLSGLVSAFSARLTKWLKPRNFGMMLFAVCALSCLTLAMTENPFLSVSGVLLVSVSSRLMSPLETELENEAITATDRATALSMNALFMDILAVFTNLIFGKLADWNLSVAMAFGAILCLLGLFLYMESLRQPLVS